MRAKLPARHPRGRESARPTVDEAVAPRLAVARSAVGQRRLVPVAVVAITVRARSELEVLRRVRPDLARLMEAGIGPS